MVDENDSRERLTDFDLIYSATARCQECGAGLAYELDIKRAVQAGAWKCSRAIRGECDEASHTMLPFASYKVREESSINNREGCTTRPEGSECLTVGYATCPECKWKWKSEPYKSCGLPHHWFSGPCPECGYSVGGGGSHSSTEGTPIEHFYTEVVQ